jgi:hypothetical protein
VVEYLDILHAYVYMRVCVDVISRVNREMEEADAQQLKE